MATTTGNWAVAGINAMLPSGNLFYNPATGGQTKPSAATVMQFPHVEFDTYVTCPGDLGGGIGAPNITGYHAGLPGPGSWGGPSPDWPGFFSVSWGDLVVDPPGSYEIARLTFPLGVFPSTPSSSWPSETSQVSPDSTALIPDIPEPHCIALILSLAVVLRRQARVICTSNVILGIGLLSLIPACASAQITAFWQQNTITPQAIAADPALANMQSWSLMATTTGNWASAAMNAQLLTGGVFYNPAAGGNTKPSAATIAMFPHVEFDTYATCPGDQGGGVGAPALIGGYPPSGGPDPPDFGGLTGRFGVIWGDVVKDPPGTFEIARLTFPTGVLPEVRNLTPDPQTTSPSFTAQVTPDSTTIIPDIPEPNVMGLVLGAALLALARRKSMVRMAALIAFVLLPFLPTTASAQITAFWQQNTITPQAIAADSTLANMQSWSLMATTTSNWASAGMQAILPFGQGVFYNPPQGGSTKPSAATITTFPNVEFDTYVTSPLDEGGGVGAPNLLGKMVGGPGPPLFGDLNGHFNVFWGNLINDPPGTFEYARLTFPLGILPDVRNRIPDPTEPIPSNISQVTPDSTTVVPEIPEPHAIGLVLGALLLVRRRGSSRVTKVCNSCYACAPRSGWTGW